MILATADFAIPECRAVCDEILKRYSNVIPIRLYVQMGTVEDTVHDLIRLISGSHFIIQPTDMEEDPALLKEVIRLAKLYPDAIISGSRAISQSGFSRYSLVKRVLYRGWAYAFSILYGRRATDSTLFYRCMPSGPVKRIKLTARSYASLFELFLRMLRIGFPVIEFPVEVGNRTEGKSSTKFFPEGIRYTYVLFKTRFTPISRFFPIQ